MSDCAEFNIPLQYVIGHLRAKFFPTISCNGSIDNQTHNNQVKSRVSTVLCPTRHVIDHFVAKINTKKPQNVLYWRGWFHTKIIQTAINNICMNMKMEHLKLSQNYIQQHIVMTSAILVTAYPHQATAGKSTIISCGLRMIY